MSLRINRRRQYFDEYVLSYIIEERLKNVKAEWDSYIQHVRKVPNAPVSKITLDQYIEINMEDLELRSDKVYEIWSSNPTSTPLPIDSTIWNYTLCKPSIEYNLIRHSINEEIRGPYL